MPTFLKHLLSVAVRKIRRDSATHRQEAAMNSDTELVIREFIEEFGEAGVYAVATNAWKYGDRAFRGMGREEMLRAVKDVLGGGSG